MGAKMKTSGSESYGKFYDSTKNSSSEKTNRIHMFKTSNRDKAIKTY